MTLSESAVLSDETAEEETVAPKSRVFVLYTGGTLGMVLVDKKNPASALRPGLQHELEEYLPDDLEKKLGIEFEMRSLQDLEGNDVPPIDSSDVTSDHWCFIANAIANVYHDYDGFVILHGTDTMCYSASALSFMLSSLSKPVVITGSQLPISHPRTDAVSNFVNALYVAGHRASGLPLIPEVVIVFAGTVLRGNRSRKMSSSAWQGFDTPNYPHLGSIGEHMRIATEYLRAPADEETSPFFATLELESRIADISLFPGIQAEQLESILLSKGLKGAILRTYGSGNAPSDEPLLDVISQSVKAGKVIVNVTQCPEGMVEAGLYAASSGLLERGVISGLDLTPEAALTKLMVLLANEPTADVQSLMQLERCGEQSASLYDIRFGASDAPSASHDPENCSVTVSAHTGTFKKANLQQATVRLRGLKVDGQPAPEDLKLNLFLNYPRARRSSINDARYVGQLKVDANGDGLLDVTTVGRRVLEDGRPAQVTLVAPQGVGRIDFDQAFLALFTR